jgi:ketosteroid isomerase-like protein
VLFRALVRRATSRVYERLSAGDYATPLRSFAPTAVLRFYGDHALGGHIEGREAIRAWFERLLEIFPDLRLRPLTIVVNGFPWDAVVATRFVATATLPDGRPYANNGMQLIRLRWGRVVEDLLFEDTAALSQALTTIAAAGRPVATAAPLGSL